MSTTVDFGKIGKDIDVPEVLTYSPDGKDSMYIPHWDAEHARKGLEIVKDMAGSDDHFIVTGHVEPWITLAAKEALAPAKVEAGSPMGVTPFLMLKRGDPDPNLDAKFNFLEEGDNLYLEFTTDKPGALHHTFNPDDVEKIIVPIIPEGKNLFIHGLGMYVAQNSVYNTFLPDCKSLWVACHEDPVYHCCVSKTPEYSFADEYPRKFF